MTAISTTFKLNVKNKQWKKCADMNHARATHATVAFQNCLYVFGGRTSSGNILESVEKYSSNEDIWIIISSMPRPAMGLAAVCDLNSIWLVGGITKEVPGNYKKSILTDVYSFIPTSNKWYPEEPLPEGRAFSSCIFKNNYLLVLGGCCISDDVQEIPITSCSSVLCMPLHIVPRKWRSEANLLYPRHAFSTASYGNLIYVIGGILSSKKSACGKVEVFDPESKTSSIGAELPVKIAGTSSILLPSGKLDASRHELDKCLQLPLLGARYLKKEETKSNVPPFVKSLSVIDSYLAVPHIVVMGGEDIQDDSYAVAIGRLMLSLDPVKPKWKLCTLMPVSRSYHCAIFLNGCIYVIGGIDLKKSVNNRHIIHDVVIYNLSERRWQKKTPMNYPRAFHSVAAVGGIIYVFGGRNENEDIISSVEAYNPQENCWTVCRSSPYPIAGAAVTVINNLVYVFGGMTCQEDEEVISSSTLIFDPQSNSWMNGPDLPKPTVYSGASSHLNLGWIFGGLVESKQHATSVKDIFQLDVRRQKWKKIGKLSVPRHSSVIISISSQTYVIGGFSTEINECVCSCDVVYPLKKKVSSLTPFPHPLIGMSGILIPPPVSQV
ncbi:beta-scruin-like isoform X2 [Stegodyphus dumicola]|uniref:beta-scruin-like isoform X2 n=1 Tax=Stegodyphus dumicola TaxID=202533 RepID=UPI0015A92F08|nr:beta-scruin-like isoform X2 [Stegodyphus dumicola]